MPRGDSKTDGTTTKIFFSLDAPKGLAEERTWEWKSDVKGNIYVIKLNKKSDLDYIMFFSKQKHKSFNT
jgi:hypothetical protein